MRVACGDPWSKREKNTQRSQRVIRSLNPSSSSKPASFEEPVSKTRCRYRFCTSLFRVRGCTAAGRSGGSAGTAKKSSHPGHFRCWSLRLNELECINLVYWREALYGFSSRDAIIIIVAGFVLEKHFGGDFPADHEKDITFKRWPPGYQSWKLSLALNGLGWQFKPTVCLLFCLFDEWYVCILQLKHRWSVPHITAASQTKENTINDSPSSRCAHHTTHDWLAVEWHLGCWWQIVASHFVQCSFAMPTVPRLGTSMTIWEDGEKQNSLIMLSTGGANRFWSCNLLSFLLRRRRRRRRSQYEQDLWSIVTFPNLHLNYVDVFLFVLYGFNQSDGFRSGWALTSQVQHRLRSSSLSTD